MPHLAKFWISAKCGIVYIEKKRLKTKIFLKQKNIDFCNLQKIENLQPKTLPFPYTRVQDFEAVVKQPIGKDWNTATVTGQLCRPSVVTKVGFSLEIFWFK